MAQGKIFLAEQRGIIETKNVKHYSTFNFGNYFNEHKQPFGALKLLNEEYLAGSAKAEFTVNESTHVLILPITGDVYFSSDTMTGSADVEEIQICSLPPGGIYRIINRYPANYVNYLHLQLQATLEGTFLNNLKFNLQQDKNSLINLIDDPLKSSLPYSISIGLFDGRKEFVYSLKQEHSQIFAFALAGAFELDGRLLHAGDGLALWNLKSFELEALSNNAILLVLDFFEKNSSL